MMPTEFQQQILALIKKLNAEEFEGWFHISSVMATVQVESAFKPQASRFEPALGVSSYGLMQVLSTTAKGVGLAGDPKQMFQPEISLRIGMRVHRQDWDVLRRRFGRDPTLDEWTDAYNRGAGGQMLGSHDHAYVTLWEHARAIWLPFDDRPAVSRETAPEPLPAHTVAPLMHNSPAPVHTAAPAEDDSDAEAERLNAEEAARRR